MNFYETLLTADIPMSYLLALSFLAFYPVATALVWVSNSLLFYFRRERQSEPGLYHLDAFPMVSVVIPAFCEGETIADTIESVLEMDYPFMEVVVVDDASTDDTADRVMPFVEQGKVRLIRKTANEGLSMALNDAMPIVSGEIVLALGASAKPEPDLLRWLVPHFKSARVGGVTTTQRASNPNSLAARLQRLEFACVSALRLREQRVWGRGLTEPGVVAAYRKSALVHVGLWTPDAATPDVDLTWNLQRSFYDVRFEPQAVVQKRLPSTLKGLLHRSLRHAKGRSQILTGNDHLFRGWKHRRHWSVLVEAAISISWSYGIVFLAGLWLAGRLGTPTPLSESGIPFWWAMLFGAISVVQVLTGVFIDSKYKGGSTGLVLMGMIYPVLYWATLPFITAIAVPLSFIRPRSGRAATWQPQTEVTGD